jgi:hypothetical protein
MLPLPKGRQQSALNTHLAKVQIRGSSRQGLNAKESHQGFSVDTFFFLRFFCLSTCITTGFAALVRASSL